MVNDNIENYKVNTTNIIGSVLIAGGVITIVIVNRKRSEI